NVKPGGHWRIEDSQSVPGVGKLTIVADNTLRRRLNIDGNDAAEIASIIRIPLDIRVGHDEIAKSSDNPGDVPKDAAVIMTGSMIFNLTQVIYTANGLLQSAIGDGAMRGTMRF